MPSNERVASRSPLYSRTILHSKSAKISIPNQTRERPILNYQYGSRASPYACSRPATGLVSASACVNNNYLVSKIHLKLTPMRALFTSLFVPSISKIARSIILLLVSLIWHLQSAILPCLISNSLFVMRQMDFSYHVTVDRICQMASARFQ